MSTSTETLARYRDSEFALEDLAQSAARLLRRSATRPDDRRVAMTPDERAIRFYQSIGVMDRPLRYEGRRAIYGFRHLVQLLTVKRLQQERQPLALIQRLMAGQATDALHAALEPPIADPPPAGRDDTRPGPEAPGDVDAAPRPPRTRPVVAAEVAPGVTVTIDPDMVEAPQEILARIGVLLAQVKEDR